MGKKKTVMNLFQKYNKFSKEIGILNFHLNILNCNVDDLLAKLRKDNIVDIPKDISEEELSELIVRVIQKCNVDNPDYDSKLDEEITRIGLKTDVFAGHNKNKWNNGSFEDDYFGFGTSISSSYDDYIDSMSGIEDKKL